MTTLVRVYFAVLVSGLLLVAATMSQARTDMSLLETSELVKRGVLLFYPAPYYPDEARAQRMAGAGVFEMQIDPATGHVTSVSVVRSTGYAVLDKSATDTLRRWTFRPGTETKVRVPIGFAMRR
jgi:TonB family protein